MATALAACAAPACLGPRVDDTPLPVGRVLPPDAVVPSLYDDPGLAAAIDAHDAVGASVPLFSGFAGGAPVRYWDLGAAPEFAAPAFVLHRRENDELVELSHPPIFDQIPGDARYSPFRIKVVVEVTDAYGGEVIPSVAALNEAQERGLVGKPSLTTVNRNWPVVAAGVTVDGGGDGAVPRGDARPFYYEGQAGTFLDFGETALAADRVHVPTFDLYVLSREGGEPLSEPARGVDMDGDGDTLDTNNVFAATADDAGGASPRCREVAVTVDASVASIDSSRDQARADINSASQLVAGGAPVSPTVVAIRPQERAFDCVQRREAGSGN